MIMKETTIQGQKNIYRFCINFNYKQHAYFKISYVKQP